jgi:alanyl-tRNA synthetase
MSVEEAEAYAAQHSIAERLEAALNASLADLPSDPFTFMAEHLKANGVPSGRPAAEEGAVLKPEIAEYMRKHQLTAALQEVVEALVAATPADPTAFMADKLVAIKPAYAAGGKAGGKSGLQTVADVRQSFVDFFVKKAAHTHWPSSSVVPHEDPTLLFINAGMNQFKPVFVGQADPNSAMGKLKRAANTQKCIRAGGKHNDLDDVGKDVYHHTFFEMLGNWSFGDYFKEEAICWAWELLTEVWGIDKDRLYVTYFEGAPELGVPADTEARDLWKRFLPDDHILTGNMKDNFWEMGDTGPCGPCSEIHYDRIGGRNAAHLVNGGAVNGADKKPGFVEKDDPDVLEIWNIVFMQFNREKDRSLSKLPAPCVDTGMGLERVASVLMDKRANYDIDVFMRIFDAIQAVVNENKKPEERIRPYAGLVGDDDKDYIDMAYRVIADHIRTLTFSITDGASPSNEGRGYVLRRILRRAVRYGGEILKAPEGFFHKLVDICVEVMGPGFPELSKDPARVKAILKDEEEVFSKTLKRGIAELTKRCAKLAKGAVLPGEDAFRMYDTYGFPLDLTVLMCEEKGITCDTDGYEQQMEAAKQRAKEGGQADDAETVEAAAEEVDTLKVKMGITPTDDSPKFDWDSAAGTGPSLSSGIKAILNSKKTFLDAADASAGLVGLVTERTSYYAEAGGQVADVGTIVTAGGAAFTVEDVKKVGPYVLHVGRVGSGSVKVGDDATLSVDYARRAPIAKNHTSTHMLNYALKQALGKACDQRGSLCDAEKLRFDFAYDKPLTEKELQAAQDAVNEQIEKALPVQILVSDLEKAKAINGLRAVFGEQYPDPVRVVSVGGPGVQQMLDSPDNAEWAGQSIEFCGGTHIANSKEVRKFALLAEEGLGRGVRRILGVTFEKADEAFAEADALKAKASAAEKLAGAELEKEVAAIMAALEKAVVPAADRKKLMDTCMALKKKIADAAKGNAKELAEKAKAEAEGLADAAAAGTPVVALLSVEADAKALEGAVNAVVAKRPAEACMLIGAGKALAALAVVPKDLEAKISAKDWVNESLTLAGGKGGGKPGRAQGAARDPSKAKEVEAAAKAYATGKLAVELS